jgi:hypothetical protein
MSSETAVKDRGFRPCCWIAGLLVLLALEVVGAAVGRRSEEELWETLKDPGAALSERLAAAHILTNRGVPDFDGEKLVRRLLRDPEPRLQEMAMTTDVLRHSKIDQQNAFVKQLQDRNASQRCRFLLRFQVDHQPITSKDLRRFFRALHDRLDEDQDEDEEGTEAGEQDRQE